VKDGDKIGEEDVENGSVVGFGALGRFPGGGTADERIERETEDSVNKSRLEYEKDITNDCIKKIAIDLADFEAASIPAE
jgi:hypothetical protein